MVSYVLAQTGAKTLTYIGHSQGTIQAFSGLTINPTTAAQINLFVALAPVAYVNNQRSILLTLMADLDLVAFFELFGAQRRDVWRVGLGWRGWGAGGGG
jgi:lysosomal acid lipase/cholesteryl ester hydrolase